jgi:hypothetical protein
MKRVKIISLFLTVFVANTSLAKNWVAHVPTIHEKPRFFRVDLNNSGYFFYNENYPEYVFRVSSPVHSYQNQFIFYKIFHLNDTLMELKSLGYDDIKVNIYEQIPFDENCRRLKVLVNGTEIFHDLQWSASTNSYPPNKSLAWIDRSLSVAVKLENDSSNVLTIEALNDYRILLPEQLKSKNVLVEIFTPTSVWQNSNRIGYHSKLFFKVQGSDEFKNNPKAVLERNFFNNVDFFETNEDFIAHFRQSKIIMNNFLKMKELDENKESIFEFIHSTNAKELKAYSFETTRFIKEASASKVFLRIKQRIGKQ